MSRREIRITIDTDLKKEIGHISVDKEIAMNILCQKLLQYAIQHIEDVDLE